MTCLSLGTTVCLVEVANISIGWVGKLITLVVLLVV